MHKILTSVLLLTWIHGIYQVSAQTNLPLRSKKSVEILNPEISNHINAIGPDAKSGFEDHTIKPSFKSGNATSESNEISDNLIDGSKTSDTNSNSSISSSSESETDEESSDGDGSYEDSDYSEDGDETTEGISMTMTEAIVTELNLGEENTPTSRPTEASIEPTEKFTESERFSTLPEEYRPEETESVPKRNAAGSEDSSGIFSEIDMTTELSQIVDSVDAKLSEEKMFAPIYDVQEDQKPFADCPDGNCAEISGLQQEIGIDTTVRFNTDASPNIQEFNDYTSKLLESEKGEPVVYIDENLDPGINSVKQKKESKGDSEDRPESPDYTAFSDEQIQPNGQYSQAQVVLKRYEIPDLSDKVARDLCRTMKISRIRSSEKFLWTALKTPVTNLKRSYSLVRPRFFPGCYKWRYSYCTGSPYPPLPENCGYFSLVRIESEDCGYVKPKIKVKPKPDSQDCPCIWPCTPFFDPIQECHYADTKDPDPPSDANSGLEVLPTTPLYLNHARAAHLCRLVHRTRMDRSFQISHIPIPLNLPEKPSLADKCVQWFWKPCSVDETSTTTGNNCGAESCFPFSLKDAEVIQRGDLKLDKLCDIWIKVVSVDEKCKKFKHFSLGAPEKPDTAAISKFHDALNSSGYFDESTTTIPGNISTGEDFNITDYNKESIESVEDIGNSSDIFIGDPIYDPEADDPTGHKPQKRDDVGEDDSWLEDNTVSNDVLNIETTAIPTLESNPEETTSKPKPEPRPARKFTGNKRESICKTSDGKRLPICKMMKKALGENMYLGRPVLNRRVPSPELIQCNWFAELTICTILPKGAKNTARRKRLAYNLRGKFQNQRFSSFRQKRNILKSMKISKKVKNLKKFNQRKNLKKLLKFTTRKTASFFDVADIFDGASTNENNYDVWDDSKAVEQRDVELQDADQVVITEAPELSDSNIPPDGDNTEVREEAPPENDASPGGEVQNPPTDASAGNSDAENVPEDQVQQKPADPSGSVNDVIGEDSADKVVLDLPEKTGVPIADPGNKPTANDDVIDSVPGPAISTGSNEIVIDLRNKPVAVDPVPPPVVPTEARQPLPPSEQTDKIKSELQKGIGIALPMPDLNLVCDESGECTEESAKGPSNDELGYAPEDMIKDPHQCGVYGCFPVNTESAGKVKSRENKEPATHPDKGGYVQCSYSSGKPECKFIYLTTHKHN